MYPCPCPLVHFDSCICKDAPRFSKPALANIPWLTSAHIELEQGRSWLSFYRWGLCFYDLSVMQVAAPVALRGHGGEVLVIAASHVDGLPNHARSLQGSRSVNSDILAVNALATSPVHWKPLASLGPTSREKQSWALRGNGWIISLNEVHRLPIITPPFLCLHAHIQTFIAPMKEQTASESRAHVVWRHHTSLPCL